MFGSQLFRNCTCFLLRYSPLQLALNPWQEHDDISRRGLGSGKPWLSPKKKEIEGGDGEADRGLPTQYGCRLWCVVDCLIKTTLFPQFPHVEKASTEEVDAAHKQYMAALASLYLKHNTDENVALVIT